MKYRHAPVLLIHLTVQQDTVFSWFDHSHSWHSFYYNIYPQAVSKACLNLLSNVLQKAMAQLDKNDRQEVLDNDWLKKEVCLCKPHVCFLPIRTESVLCLKGTEAVPNQYNNDDESVNTPILSVSVSAQDGIVGHNKAHAQLFSCFWSCCKFTSETVPFQN